MKLRRPLLTSSLLAVGLALTGTACKAGAGPEAPGTEGGEATTTPDKQDAGAAYSYAENGFALTYELQTNVELNSSQGQGKLTFGTRSRIDAASHAAGQIKIHGKVLELLSFEGTGVFDPEFVAQQAEAAGQPAMDLAAEIGGAEGWYVMDLKGEKDDEATDALPEYSDTEVSMALDFGIFSLPDLPSVDLTAGEKVEIPTEQDERMTAVGPIPVEVDTTWVLRAQNGDIAELDVTIEASGAVELQGSIPVSMLEESSYTITFDVAKRVPVSVSGYGASELSIDTPQGTQKLATNSEITGAFSPADG